MEPAISAVDTSAEMLLGLLPERRGHFLLESGDHGNLWLDLDLLFTHAQNLRPVIAGLGARLLRHDVEAVCGPLAGGALVAHAIAMLHGLEFYCTHRRLSSDAGTGKVDYHLPHAVRTRLSGKRVAIVDDVINAGSAVRATHQRLIEAGAVCVAVGALLVLGDSAARFAAGEHLPLEFVASADNQIWAPDRRAMCAAEIPLEDRAGA